MSLKSLIHWPSSHVCEWRSRIRKSQRSLPFWKCDTYFGFTFPSLQRLLPQSPLPKLTGPCLSGKVAKLLPGSSDQPSSQQALVHGISSSSSPRCATKLDPACRVGGVFTHNRGKTLNSQQWILPNFSFKYIVHIHPTSEITFLKLQPRCQISQ